MSSLKRFRPRRRVVAAGFTVALSALLCACGMLQDRGPASEVEEGFTPPVAPPAFPESGPVPVETLVAALTYDFSAGAADANLWTPRLSEAECAAEQVVQAVGATRLAELGYRPATSGASLNDIDLTDLERVQVKEAFTGCVDMITLVGSLLMGDGNMTGEQAACMAEALEGSGVIDRFAEAWAFGRPIDPLAGEATLGSRLIAAADICLPDDAFNWQDGDLPGDDEEPSTADAPTTTVLGQSDGLSSRTGSATSAPGNGP